MNRWMGIGNLGADAELRFTGGGTAVCNFRIATTSRWKNAEGEKQEHTEWTSCVLWSKRAEALAPHLTKGTKIYVEGEKRTRSYEGKDGGGEKYVVEIHVTEIELLGGGAKPAEKAAEKPASGPQRKARGRAALATTKGESWDETEDNLPENY